MTVGKNIKTIRELRNFTQSYMADCLNMSVSGYGKIERDETDVTLSRLCEISEILDVCVENILTFNKDKVFQNDGETEHYQQMLTSLSSKVAQLEKELTTLRNR